MKNNKILTLALAFLITSIPSVYGAQHKKTKKELIGLITANAKKNNGGIPQSSTTQLILDTSSRGDLSSFYKDQQRYTQSNKIECNPFDTEAKNWPLIRWFLNR